MTEGGVCVTGCPIEAYEGSNARDRCMRDRTAGTVIVKFV
jgi:hypothetical protein